MLIQMVAVFALPIVTCGSCKLMTHMYMYIHTSSASNLFPFYNSECRVSEQSGFAQVLEILEKFLEF